MDLLYVKSLHIIFVVSWFSALFYIVRLFIYAKEANGRPAAESQVLVPQLLLMQARLWKIIGWPAMTGTYIFGWWMIAINPAYLSQKWMHWKLALVLLLTIYHIYCHKIHRAQKRGRFTMSSLKLRLFNELATVFLVAIVFLVVVKTTGALVSGLAGLLVFALVLMAAVFVYKKNRSKNDV